MSARDRFEWLEPWYSVDDEEHRRDLEEELAREMHESHVLFGEPVTLIARSSFTDDALFRLSDSRVAEVHLTWTGRRETAATWPGTAIFPSLAAWATERMIPWHQELIAD